MSEILQTALDALSRRYAGTAMRNLGEVTQIISREYIVAAARVLHDEFDFEMVLDITAVDYWPVEKPRFHVIYQFYSMKNNDMLRLRVPLDANSLEIDSIESMYAGVNWYEREVFDMFGIRFNGNHDLRRIIMPYDWQGYPLRKDYPLGYEEVQFTFNYDEILQRKPRPKS
jgi:NADH-quinone oxidoreductase subunit C